MKRKDIYIETAIFIRRIHDDMTDRILFDNVDSSVSSE